MIAGILAGLGRAWRSVRAAYASPARAGMVVFVAVAVLFPGPIGSAGVGADQLAAIPNVTALATALLVALWAAHLVLGLALGGLAHVAFRGWDAALGGAPSGRAQYLRVALAVLAFELWRAAVTLVHYPQLFAPWLYERGGARRGLEVLLTEHVPRAALERGGWLLVAAFVLGPLARARGRRAARAWASERRRGLALGLALVALGLAGPLVSSSALPPPPPGDGRPSFLVIGIDGLRTDRSPRVRPELAPNLARLWARSVSFENAHVTVPRTIPSLTTLLTGRWPHGHGVRHMFPTRATRAAVGPALPKALAASGWSTAVVSFSGATPLVAIDFGFENVPRLRGHDVPFLVQGAFVQRQLALLPWTTMPAVRRAFPALRTDWSCCDPEEVTDEALRALDAASPRGPSLVFAFYETTHMPYAAPDPFYRRATDPAYDGPYRYECFAYKDGGAWGERDLAQVHGLYDGCVAATDAAVGRLLEGLRARGLAERTVVVVLADHGENLGEPGLGFGHGDHLRGDHALAVPLAIADPRGRFAPRSVSAVVRDVDVAPTLAALAGVPLPSADGRDLAPLLSGEAATLDLDAFAETEVPFGAFEGLPDSVPFPRFPDYLVVEGGVEAAMDPKWEDLLLAAKHRALTTDRWKLLYEPRRQGPTWRLFDRVRDPDEREDLSEREPEVFLALRARLLSWMARDGSRLDERGFVARPGVAIPR